MKHVFTRDRTLHCEVFYFDRNSFNLMRQNIFTDEARVTMSLYLQFKLVEVDMLEI